MKRQFIHAVLAVLLIMGAVMVDTSSVYGIPTPVADNISITVTEDTPYTGQLSASVGTPSGFEIAGNGTKGTAFITNANYNSGIFSYVPNDDAAGTDTFTYRFYDEATSSYSNTATVTVTINNEPDAPLGFGSQMQTAKNTPVSGSLKATDADGDALTYSIAVQGTKGQVELAGDTGEFTYTPLVDAAGLDTFGFRANDGGSSSEVTYVEVSIGDWTKRSDNIALNSVIYANRQYVAVGDDGVVKTSPDGRDWAARPTPTNQKLNDIQWVNNRYVAVGEEGVILTSDDSAHWTLRPSGTTKALRSSAGSGTRLVAVGDGVALYSDDGGMQWSPATIPNAADQLNGVVWTGGSFVAAGQSSGKPAVFAASDGTAWSKPWFALSGSSLQDIVMQGTKLIAVGTTALVAQGDVNNLNTWSITSSSSYGTYQDIVWNDQMERFIAVGESGLVGLKDSNNNFTHGYYSSGQNKKTLSGLATNGSKLVAVGADGTVLNGRIAYDTMSNSVRTQWDLSGEKQNYALQALATNGTSLLAAGGTSVHNSPDGINWTTVTTPDFTTVYDVTYGNGHYVAAGGNGNVLVSPDGNSWTKYNTGHSQNLLGIHWNGSQYVAVGNSGTIVTSTYGTEWTQRTTGLTLSLNSIAWNGKKYVVAGSNKILTSADGTAWSDAESFNATGPVGLSTVVWNGSLFVAGTGYGGKIYTSADGEVWAEAGWSNNDTAPFPSINKIQWDGQSFTAVGNEGVMLTSTDGLKWSQVPNVPTQTDLLNAAVYPGRLLIVGKWATKLEKRITTSAAPISNDGVLTVDAGTAAGGYLVATDPERQPLTYSIASNGSKGTVTLVNPATGQFSYQARAGTGGTTDTFTFTANDGVHTSPAASVKVTITGSPNAAPEAVNGSLTVTEDSSADGTLQGTDPEQQPVTFSLSGQPAQKGTVELTNPSTGAYTYTPNPNVYGNDSFTFTVNDGIVDSEPGTVTVTITPVQDAPIAQAGALTLDEDGPPAGGILQGSDPDGDPLTFAIAGTPAAKGTVTVTDPSTGAYMYTPFQDAYGSDEFYFKVNDGHEDSAIAKISVTINPVNDTPVVRNMTVSVDAGRAAAASFDAADADGDSLTAEIMQQGSLGVTAVVYDIDHKPGFIYTPNPGATGNDEFTFRITDGKSAPVSAKVTVTIQPAANNRLASLTVAGGALLPAFSPNVEQYSVVLGEDSGRATVTASVYDPYATGTLLVDGQDKASLTTVVELEAGQSKLVEAKVVAQNGAVRTYRVTITRDLSSNADLLQLTAEGAVLNPEFNPQITQYTARYGPDTATAAVTAIVYDRHATVKIYSGLAPSVNLTNPVQLSPGDNPFLIVVTAQNGLSTKTYHLNLFRESQAEPPPPPVNRGNRSNGTSVTEPQNKIEVIVDGVKQEQSAALTLTKEGDTTVALVKVDNGKVLEKLASEDNKLLTIPVSMNAGTVVVELNGKLVKAMESKAAVVRVETAKAVYTLPAVQVNIAEVSERIGREVALEDIKINIRIAEPSREQREMAQATARNQGIELLTGLVEFEVKATYGDRTVAVTEFNSYVERSITLTDLDPAKITTGVLLQADGTLIHVPTKVINTNGKYHAVINSLTNSSYGIVWSPKTMADVENHWSRDDVNDMASRQIIKGISETEFAPDRSVTRAEFAAIAVRALGLHQVKGYAAALFNDVPERRWFHNDIAIAAGYGLINGYEDGSFRPERTITRAEAAIVIANALKLAGAATGSSGSADGALASFADRDLVGDWARSAFAEAVKRGILQGYDGKLQPLEELTRAQASAIMRRTLQQANLINR